MKVVARKWWSRTVSNISCYMLAYLFFDTMLLIMHTFGLLVKTLITFGSTELF